LDAQVAALGRMFDELHADVLVDGAFPFAPRLFSELRGIPHASLFAGCFPIPTSDPLFPHGPGHAPPTDERGRAAARLASVIQADRDREEVVAWDAARTSLGLPACGAHPWRSAASRHLVLLASSPAFEYPRSDLPRQFWFIGPLVWQPRLVPMPPRVAALTDGEPIVYVTQGATFNQHPVVLKLAFDALGSEPVRIVATVVRTFDQADFQPIPPNVILERFVPFSQLVHKLSVAITHGGAGSVHAALSYGVPLVVLPLTADQFEVAARCAWTGAGVRLDARDCTPEQLRAAVRTVLADPSFRTNSRYIMASHARYHAAEIGASLLERLAATRQPVERAAGSNPWAANMRRPSSSLGPEDGVVCRPPGAP
jgi:UDP:flavonoid glycosyltransferase YjiC (YdhE family)